VNRILDKSGVRPFEASSKAAELTSSLYGRVYAMADPIRVAACARGLEVGTEYSLRLLRRYREDLIASNGRRLIHRLVHAYPSHDFIIDLEELADLGLPARAPEGKETPLLDELAPALVEYRPDSDLIRLVPSPKVAPQARAAPAHRMRRDLKGPGHTPESSRAPEVSPWEIRRGRFRMT